MDTNRNANRRISRTPVINRHDIILIHRMLVILSRGINSDGESIAFNRDPEVTSSCPGNKRVSAGSPLTSEMFIVRDHTTQM